MKQFRNLTNDALSVHYGVVGTVRRIVPGGIVTVTDETGASYECQPETWQPVLVTGPTTKPGISAPASPPAEEEAK